MDFKSKNIQLQYQGFSNTALLWKEHAVFGLQQLEFSKQSTIQFNETISDNLFLGKRVERFVYAELRQHKNIKILIENAQIQNQKITIGELDCILKWDDEPIHLEIIYKFYLFDSRIGSTEIVHWIGPNRNDTLIKKLQKLRDKQLPLIQSPHTKFILNTFNLNADDILQRVYFKAQLFVPYKASDVHFELLNKDCLSGFYVHLSEIAQFSNCKFYVPIKVDWLIEIQTYVAWLSYDQFYEKVSPLINKKTAPLCWIKFPNGIIQKFFVVWWD